MKMKNVTITGKIKLAELRKLIAENAFKVFAENDDELNQDNNNDLDKNPAPAPEVHPETKVDDSTPVDNGIENENSNFSNLSDIIKKISSGIDKTKLENLDSEIIKAISTGRVSRNFTFDRMVSESKNRKDFDYFTTVLATLYKNADIAEKENIRKVLFLALPVYNVFSSDSGNSDIRPSSFAKTVAQKSGIGYDFNVNAKTIDASYYIDIIVDAVYDAIDYFLKNYDSERGGLFTAQVLFKAASLAKDALGSKLHQKTFAAGGQKYSIDDQLGTSEDERDETKADRITGTENEVSVGEREAAKEFANALKSFVQQKLSQKENLRNYLEFFNYFTQGYNLSEIADIMEKEPGNLRVIKKRMEDFITKFVESGELQDFIGEETGIKVDFPNNKFTLSVKGTGRGTGEVEPVEIFQITGNNPSTGEPVGEWVQITPDVHDSDTSWFDRYGDLVFDKEENKQEPEVEAGTENASDETGEEKTIAESLMKIVKTKIFKNQKK